MNGIVATRQVNIGATDGGAQRDVVVACIACIVENNSAVVGSARAEDEEGAAGGSKTVGWARGGVDDTCDAVTTRAELPEPSGAGICGVGTPVAAAAAPVPARR